MNKKFVPGKTVIPASYPSVGEAEKSEIQKVLDRGWYTDGKACQEFRHLLSEKTRQAHIQLCNSGSSANLLAITALASGYQQNINNYVITCAVGFPTTLSPIYQNNQLPLFIDIDPETLAPSMGHLQYVLEKEEYRDKIIGAVLPHTLGFPYDERLAKKLLGNKFLISDCCDALGATIYHKPVGSFSDASTYSFFPAHQICTAEGGAVAMRDKAIAKQVASLNNWGRDCHCLPGQSGVCGRRFASRCNDLPEGWDHKYTFSNLGYNLKMTEFQGAMGVAQMSKLKNIVRLRQENFLRLGNRLGKFSEWIKTVTIPEFAKPSPFGFPITVHSDEFTAQDLINHLENHKISTRRLFGGNLVRQPAFANLPRVSATFEGADYVTERTFWIGCGPWMTDVMIDYIEDIFGKFFSS